MPIHSFSQAVAMHVLLMVPGPFLRRQVDFDIDDRVVAHRRGVLFFYASVY